MIENKIKKYRDSIMKNGLDYINRGFSIIPMKHKDKFPSIKWKEYQEKKSTINDLKNWMNNNKLSINIGIITGKISNLVVVDIDKGADIKALKLPPTVIVNSGGGGYHYYYRYPKGVDNIKTFAGIKKNVDIRGDGGVIVAPPSIHKSLKPYEWAKGNGINDKEISELPKWIIDECSGNKKIEKVTFKDLIKQINHEGIRNTITTKVAGYITNKNKGTKGLLEELLKYNNSNNNPPLAEKEINEIYKYIAKNYNSKSKGKGKKDDKEEKKEILISEENENTLIETIINKESNTPELFIYDKKNKTSKFQATLTLGEDTFKAIPNRNSLYTSGALLFCSKINEEYGNKDDLIKYIRKFIYKYVDCSEEYLIILSYYVLFTYFYKSYEVLPYLRVIGDYGSGKSQLLKTVGSLCYNPMIMNGSASIATVFRVISMVKGSLVYDEADIEKSDTTNEFIKILNNGYQKGMSVFRSDGNDFSPKAFEVFGPKIIGGRMEFHDKATESRCLSEIMKPTKRNDISKIDNSFHKEAEHIRNMCFHYKLDNLDKKFDNKYLLEGLEPRVKQILEPILSIIDNQKEAKIIIKKISLLQEGLIEDRQYSLDGAVFRVMKDSFENNNGKMHITSIVAEINNSKEYLFRNLSSRSISGLLRQHGIKSSRNSKGVFIEYNLNINLLLEIFKRYHF